jgi:hypothetical protein
MRFFKRKPKYRWSLFVVHGGADVRYPMHENSAMRMVGYVMGRFADGAEPMPPWSLVLNCNLSNAAITLASAHFSKDGENVTRRLMENIKAVDPGYEVAGAPPVVIDQSTGKQVPLGVDLLATLEARDKNETTFSDIMDMVFGQRNNWPNSL